eukprot:COSAG06_NODE_58_length_27483_cov_37.992989_10_plen_124_part_00
MTLTYDAVRGDAAKNSARTTVVHPPLLAPPRPCAPILAVAALCLHATLAGGLNGADLHKTAVEQPMDALHCHVAESAETAIPGPIRSPDAAGHVASVDDPAASELASLGVSGVEAGSHALPTL